MAKTIIFSEQTEEKQAKGLRKKERFIIDAASSVMDQDALGAKELAFMSRCFVQATLPHSDPGDVQVWGRRNGNYTLTIQPAYIFDKHGIPICLGVPYGSIPRMILAWISTEVVRTKAQELYLGESFAEFLAHLGYGSSGRDRSRVKGQALRLFSSRISLVYETKTQLSLRSANIVDDADYFWQPEEGERGMDWSSRLVLSEKFYESILGSQVPLDWRILKALKQSPLALDLYMWITHRNFNLDKPVSISWKALHAQFGSEYKNLYKFRQKVRENLKKIQAIWPSLKLDASSQERITLNPSPILLPRRPM